MNCLAGRTPTSLKQTGSIEFNGIAPLEWINAGEIAYVQQHDRLLPNLTVRETLLFAAKLRLADSMPLIQKIQHVDDIILDLGLKDVANSIVGRENEGISGGEKRRVSVGIQLLVNRK